MERKTNESYLSYAKRLTNGVEDGIIEYKEYADSLIGADNVYSSENIRKFYYIFKKVLSRLDENVELSEDDIRKEIEAMKDELYKERVRLQDANREKRNYLRNDSRFENLVEVLEKCLLTNKWHDPLPYNENLVDVDERWAVLCFSDWHTGSIVDNEFNFYNLEVMEERAYKIRDKAITQCKNNGVTSLVVEINGDMIDGLIHIGSRVEQEEDTISQIVTVSDLLSNIVNSMKPHFKEIKVVTTLGNHARLHPNKADASTKENFETLIPVFMRRTLKDVKIIDSHGLDFVRYRVADRLICVSHGQNDKLNTVIDDFSKLYKEVPDECHLGHTHGYKDINNCDIIVNVNGSLIGGNDYSLTIRKMNKPSQNLIIYGEDRMVIELKAE